MKFCIVSDTHNNLEYITTLANRIRDKVATVIHLGDDSPDADIFLEYGFKVIKVPCVFEQIY